MCPFYFFPPGATGLLGHYRDLFKALFEN